ncbi:MAG: HAD family phosphatase [Parachlamydiaceae bacterium]|nr:HAD family phosphatase [Parachlamydiaceae bacterium]
MNLYNIQKPKALLIDMDGTLIDTLPMLYEAYMGFLKSYGVLGTPKEFQSLMGPSLSEIIDSLKHRYKLTDDRSALLETYQQGLKEAYEQKVNFFPHALEAIHYAKKQDVKLALVSASEKQFVNAFIKGAHLASLFDFIVFSQQGIRSKPYPDLYLKSLKLLQLDASDVLAIEDSVSGVQAATSAEIFTLWIKHNTFFASHSAPNPLPIPNVSKDLYHQVDDWKNILIWLKEKCDA